MAELCHFRREQTIEKKSRFLLSTGKKQMNLQKSFEPSINGCKDLVKIWQPHLFIKKIDMTIDVTIKIRS